MTPSHVKFLHLTPDGYQADRCIVHRDHWELLYRDADGAELAVVVDHGGHIVVDRSLPRGRVSIPSVASWRAMSWRGTTHGNELLGETTFGKRRQDERGLNSMAGFGGGAMGENAFGEMGRCAFPPPHNNDAIFPCESTSRRSGTPRRWRQVPGGCSHDPGHRSSERLFDSKRELRTSKSQASRARAWRAWRASACPRVRDREACVKNPLIS